MRLIDADALMVRCEELDLKKDVIDVITDAPTKDPLKHAFWKIQYFKSSGNRWCCSRCKHAQQTQSAFCGGCGARMDGDCL